MSIPQILSGDEMSEIVQKEYRKASDRFERAAQDRASLATTFQSQDGFLRRSYHPADLRELQTTLTPPPQQLNEISPLAKYHSENHEPFVHDMPRCAHESDAAQRFERVQRAESRDLPSKPATKGTRASPSTVHLKRDSLERPEAFSSEQTRPQNKNTVPKESSCSAPSLSKPFTLGTPCFHVTAKEETMPSTKASFNSNSLDGKPLRALYSPRDDSSQSQRSLQKQVHSQAVSDVYLDGRRSSLTNANSGLKRTAPIDLTNLQRHADDTLGSKSKDAIVAPNDVVALKERYPLPQWTTAAKREYDNPKKHSNTAELKVALINFRTAIERARTAKGAETRLSCLHKIREYLSTFEHIKVDRGVVASSRILDAMSNGLPCLQGILSTSPDAGGDDNAFPCDIRADALMLYRKWERQDFDSDIMRGIKVTAKSRELDKTYTLRLKADFTGEGYLANGQWWPFQICALRDGAHGQMQAGIHGKAGVGAYSIVISDSEYEDKDYGDELEYTGTKASESQNSPSADTELLMTNIRTRLPVRVLRASKLKSQYAPECGMRYDGLYEVNEQELLDKSKHHYRFRMSRLPGQDPVRWTGPGRRPSQKDKEIYRQESTRGACDRDRL